MRSHSDSRSISISSRLGHIFASVHTLAIFVALGAFLLFWRTAAPTVLPGDSGELQFAPWGFWLAHPTGYPLFLILGGIWQHILPVGDPAFRMNLFSAFWSAATVGLAFATFWNVTQSRAASTIAALTFAVSPLFWSQATRAEVYALNTFFLALLTLLGILWHDRGQRRYAFAFALTFGLALTHHRTTILLIPAFAALFANRLFAPNSNSIHTAKRALLYGLVAVIPLMLYLYIPLRAGATPYATIDLSPASPIVVFENSPRGWLSIIMGSGFSGELGFDAGMWDALRAFPERWLAQFNPLAILIILLGLGALLWQRKYSISAFVVFMSGAYLGFNSIYHIGDIADYYTPVYFVSCLSLAVGIAFLVDRTQALLAARMSMLPTIVVLACLAALPMQNLFANFFARDSSHQTATRARWGVILASNLPDNAILLSNDRDEMTPLYYLQLVEKQMPNWVGIFPQIAAGPGYANVVSLVQRVAGSGRPIFSIKPISALTLRYPVEEIENGLWQIHPFAPALPEHLSDVVLANRLRVRGYSLIGGKARAGERMTLAVQYVPLASLSHNFTTSIQLLDDAGQKAAQGNDHIPGEAEYPSSKWRVGETIQDQFDIELNPTIRTGTYRVMLRVYEPSSSTELGDLTAIGQVEIEGE